MKKKYLYNDKVFSDIKTEEEAYWLGFIMADGHNYKNKRLRVDIKDNNHLEKLSHLIYPNKDKPIQSRDLGYGNIYMFNCSVVKIVENLNRYGVVPNKSKKVKLPVLKNDMYRHFIRGLYDGDGSLNYTMAKNSPNYRRYNYSIVGNYDLIEGVRYLISKYVDVNLKVYEMKSIHRISKKGNKSILSILEWMYRDSTIFLERKHEKYIDLINYYKKKGGK